MPPNPAADVDVVVVSVLRLVASPSSGFLLRRRIALPPPRLSRSSAGRDLLTHR